VWDRRESLRRGRHFSTTSANWCRITVPTVTLRVLFVFIILEHRREVLHFNVTEHPAAAWTSQQIVEAFLDWDALRSLIRDRGSIYGTDVGQRSSLICIEEVLTAPGSPWQNPYGERLIGSIPGDCLNRNQLVTGGCSFDE